MNINSQAKPLLRWLRQIGLLFSSLLLLVLIFFLPYLAIMPATQLIALAEAFFITYLYPPAVIFKGFSIVAKQNKASFWQLFEALMVILATSYFFISLYKGLYKGIITAQALTMVFLYFFLVTLSVLGFFLLLNEYAKQNGRRRSYIILLASTVGAANVNLFMLNTAKIASSFVGTIPIFWRLLPLLIFTVPSLTVLLRQIHGKGKSARATFLIWSGLGSMLTVVMIFFNSFGRYYFPIYILLAVIALLIEFLPRGHASTVSL